MFILSQDKCLGNSPIHSSADGNYTAPSTLPMVTKYFFFLEVLNFTLYLSNLISHTSCFWNWQNFSADLSDLDGPVVQRRQEMGYSSSSDSPHSPEYEKMPGLFISSSLFKIILMEILLCETFYMKSTLKQFQVFLMC